mmetsp:Transcript_2735/g.4673  ORF Transcript_2735/g.4673 Transcript_2735/m.4673 type:complete len:251 (-) Transcript_2735:42-794(-)
MASHSFGSTSRVSSKHFVLQSVKEIVPLADLAALKHLVFSRTSQEDNAFSIIFLANGLLSLALPTNMPSEAVPGLEQHEYSSGRSRDAGDARFPDCATQMGLAGEQSQGVSENGVQLAVEKSKQSTADRRDGREVSVQEKGSVVPVSARGCDRHVSSPSRISSPSASISRRSDAPNSSAPKIDSAIEDSTSEAPKGILSSKGPRTSADVSVSLATAFPATAKDVKTCRKGNPAERPCIGFYMELHRADCS